MLDEDSIWQCQETESHRRLVVGSASRRLPPVAARAGLGWLGVERGAPE